MSTNESIDMGPAIQRFRAAEQGENYVSSRQISEKESTPAKKESWWQRLLMKNRREKDNPLLDSIPSLEDENAVTKIVEYCLDSVQNQMGLDMNPALLPAIKVDHGIARGAGDVALDSYDAFLVRAHNENQALKSIPQYKVGEYGEIFLRIEPQDAFGVSQRKPKRIYLSIGGIHDKKGQGIGLQIEKSIDSEKPFVWISGSIAKDRGSEQSRNFILEQYGDDTPKIDVYRTVFNGESGTRIEEVEDTMLSRELKEDLLAILQGLPSADQVKHVE